MVQVLERPEVKEHERDTLVREEPQVRRERRPEAETPRPVQRRPIRWMRWLLLGIVLMVGAGVAIVVVNGNETSAPAAVTRDYRTADGWERFMAKSMGTLDYRTADGFERALGSLQPVMNDHRTADGWERYVTELRADLIAK